MRRSPPGARRPRREEARLAGEIASALLDRADELLQEPPQIERVEVLATK